MVILTADDGMVYTNGETYGREICLPDSADVSVWHQIREELIGVKYSTGLILEAIGRMGSDVYDAAKAYMQANRVNGAVIWDLLVSGDYIEADNPCVIAARDMVIADGICTAEQFDAVLAASVISE